MLLAPTPELRAQLHRLPDGYAGIMATLRCMRTLVKAARTSYPIRSAATSIIWLEPQHDGISEVAALFEWVRDRVRYVRDVLDVETLSTPEKTLIQRAGDCDDQTTLLAALLESVGYQTRFVIAAYTVPGHFEHVYLQVNIDGQWIDADPTEPHSLGWAPPDPLSIMVES